MAWREWSFLFTNYIYSLIMTLGDLMVKCQALAEQISLPDDEASATIRQQASKLQSILISLLKERPLRLLQKQHAKHARNGLKSWRVLSKHYGKPTMRSMTLLQDILAFNMDQRDVQDSIARFELHIRDYESLPGSTVSNDELKRSLLLAKVPGHLKDHIYATASHEDTYSEVRDEAIHYATLKFELRRNKKSHGDDMEIDAACHGKDGKGGNHGKSKGKSKDKSKSQGKTKHGKFGKSKTNEKPSGKGNT
jgi:hypothetical protein